MNDNLQLAQLLFETCMKVCISCLLRTYLYIYKSVPYMYIFTTFACMSIKDVYKCENSFLGTFCMFSIDSELH